ncbi:FAD-linked oxidase C-terminal domain-containing protein [Thioalkalivibrio thiocyanodenitrificans]|uniref:FAD-linked oxidase C-terminal domain-containing protein n=1 Tax=Thioalkalivibrio thiocyanodenitrificans TaxID=243063 RepID=UPI000367EA5F
MHAEARQTTLDARQREDLMRDLAAALPAEGLLHTVEDMRPYECDGLAAYRRLPMAVALPETLEQAQAVLHLCREAKVPVVARGAGTGLSGGALPLENGLILSLARFNQILEVDVENRCAVVQPGVRNLAITEAASPHGLYYAPDPSSQIACTIGGNVAENSGGVHCLKYGLTVHNVIGLKFLNMDGDLITLGGKTLDAPGYDLLALMTGSEGMLGVMVEVTVRLLPKPDRAQVLLASFDQIDDAGHAVAAIIGAGIIAAGLEMMDNPAIRAAEDFVHAGYPVDAAAVLLCELDGSNAEVSEQILEVRELLLAHKATAVLTAETDEQRDRFWAGRKAAFPAVGRISPDYYCMDGTIPRKHLATVLNRIGTLGEAYGLRVANVFHAGDGNLHPLILFDANNEGELEKAEELGGEILELCVEVGGTITGEHGVGVEKLNQMCVQFSAEELTQFHAIKAAFDPDGLLNPGKAVPTLHRCAEFGAMHVKQGKLPFPELPRF